MLWEFKYCCFFVFLFIVLKEMLKNREVELWRSEYWWVVWDLFCFWVLFCLVFVVEVWDCIEFMFLEVFFCLMFCFFKFVLVFCLFMLLFCIWLFMMCNFFVFNVLEVLIWMEVLRNKIIYVFVFYIVDG